MRVLAVETSTLAGGVALLEGGRLVAEYVLDVSVTHSERLMAAVERALRDARWAAEDLQGLAVAIGPGSFTGLRIGVSTVKGLALALEIPVAPVPTLDGLARRVPFAALPVCPVLDARKMPVRGLTAEDFTIIDKGKPQKVTVFTEVAVAEPVVPTTGWMKEVEPDIKRNDDMNERRLIVLVIDDAQIDSKNPRIANNVKIAARAVIDQLGPTDLAAVIYTMDSRNMQEFTTDRARLLAAVDRFSPSMDGNMELFQRYSVGTLRRASEYLAEIPQRRKAMFYISTGVAVDVAGVAAPVSATIRNDIGGDRVGQVSYLMQEMNEVYRQAQLANVNIHAIDPSNLEGEGGPGVFNIKKDFLFSVSSNTGGTPIVNRADYESAIAEVFRENSSYYLLGYEPTSGNDGKYHGLEIRVNRPGLTVRARSGYYAPDAISSVESGRSAKAGPHCGSRRPR